MRRIRPGRENVGRNLACGSADRNRSAHIGIDSMQAHIAHNTDHRADD
jgi:hypothetical protein